MSNSPLSVILSSGITGNDINARVINGSSSVHPISCDALFSSAHFSSTKLKSLIMYRIAFIYNDKNDKKNALHSAEYEVSLNEKIFQAKLQQNLHLQQAKN